MYTQCVFAFVFARALALPLHGQHSRFGQQGQLQLCDLCTTQCVSWWVLVTPARIHPHLIHASGTHLTAQCGVTPHRHTRGPGSAAPGIRYLPPTCEHSPTRLTHWTPPDTSFPFKKSGPHGLYTSPPRQRDTVTTTSQHGWPEAHSQWPLAAAPACQVLDTAVNQPLAADSGCSLERQALFPLAARGAMLGCNLGAPYTHIVQAQNGPVCCRRCMRVAVMCSQRQAGMRLVA